MRKVILYIVALQFIICSCEPRIDIDMDKWGDHAYIDNVQLFKLDVKDDVKLQEWYENETLVTGVRQIPISDGNAVIDSLDYTATIKLVEGEDITRVGVKFWHKATLIEPLEGAPKAGVINDFSSRTFKYRLHSADGSVHDWTLNIVD